MNFKSNNSMIAEIDVSPFVIEVNKGNTNIVTVG